jgi:predicted transglutaminase-like cysteine proteinase
VVTLYSYRTRETTTYRADRCGRFHSDLSTEPAATAEAVHQPSGDDPSDADRRAAGTSWVAPPIVLAVIAVAILGVLLLPLAQASISHLRTAGTEFDEFLAQKLSFSRLVAEVSTRVDYRVDLEDYWSAPSDAWRSKVGDCEDHAMIVSAYLAHHGIDHSVLGFALRDGLQGHVVVVADSDRGPVLLDPTRASAPTGLKRFAPGTEIADVVSEYGVLPAANYGQTPTTGRPAPIGVVE